MMVLPTLSFRLASLAAGATVLALSGCARPMLPDRVHPAADHTRPQVVVIKSDPNPYYDLPVELFVAQVDASLAVFTLRSDTKLKALVKAVRRTHPDLVLTLGTKATLLARDHLTDVPIIFSMVVNYRRHDLQNARNIAGIALETPTLVEFTKFKMVVPSLSKVLTFYVKHQSDQLVAEAGEEIKAVGVELVAVEVDDQDGIERAYREHAQRVDGVWLLNDPVVMNPRTFQFLRDRTIEDRLPFFCSLSETFTRQGALMSVSVDFHNLGSQAAALAKMILDYHKSPAELGVQPPIGGKLVVNLDVAEKIGLRIPEDLYPLIHEIVSAGQSTGQMLEPK